jgi:hypothetical protein
MLSLGISIFPHVSSMVNGLPEISIPRWHFNEKVAALEQKVVRMRVAVGSMFISILP